VICPYCMEAVSSGATVCKSCQRDFALVKSLLKEKHDLEDRVVDLERELARYRPADTEEGAAAAEPAPPQPLRPLDVVPIFMLLPIVLLIGAHYLLIIKFDSAFSLIGLRAASIVLPAIFGLVLERRSNPRWFVTLGIGIVVAFASVLGMSTIVHFTDGEPILPKGGHAWRETLEYVASISLAYLLGALMARGIRPTGARGGRSSGRRMTGFATFLVNKVSGSTRGAPIEVRVQRMIKLINIGVSAATAAGAVYTGFKGIL
jgi:hypothetical protein